MCVSFSLFIHSSTAMLWPLALQKIPWIIGGFYFVLIQSFNIYISQNALENLKSVIPNTQDIFTSWLLLVFSAACDIADTCLLWRFFLFFFYSNHYFLVTFGSACASCPIYTGVSQSYVLRPMVSSLYTLSWNILINSNDMNNYL